MNERLNNIIDGLTNNTLKHFTYAFKAISHSALTSLLKALSKNTSLQSITLGITTMNLLVIHYPHLLISVLKEHPNLQSIAVNDFFASKNNTANTEKAFQYFIVLLKTKKLKELIINIEQLNLTQMHKIAEALCEQTSLETLKLRGEQNQKAHHSKDDKKLTTLLANIKVLPMGLNLDLKQCDLTNNTITLLSRNLDKLQLLDIQMTTIDNASLLKLSEALVKTKTLKSLKLPANGILPNTHMHFVQEQPNPEQIAETTSSKILENLFLNSTLESITLNKGMLSAEILSILSVYLATNVTLRSIAFVGTKIEEKTVAPFFKTMMNSRIKHIDFSTMSMITSPSPQDLEQYLWALDEFARTLPNNKSLKSISFEFIGDDALIYIEEALKNNVTLESINYSSSGGTIAKTPVQKRLNTLLQQNVSRKAQRKAIENHMNAIETLINSFSGETGLSFLESLNSLKELAQFYQNNNLDSERAYLKERMIDFLATYFVKVNKTDDDYISMLQFFIIFPELIEELPEEIFNSNFGAYYHVENAQEPNNPNDLVNQVNVLPYHSLGSRKEEIKTQVDEMIPTLPEVKKNLYREICQQFFQKPQLDQPDQEEQPSEESIKKTY